MRADNMRDLLLSMGIGDYNATMAIQSMFMSPAATDPAMPPVILMTEALQRGLREAGASTVQVTGQIDRPTAAAFRALVGPQWNGVTWHSLFTAVNTARQSRSLARQSSSSSFGLDFIPDVPAVPGGILTYAIGGYFLWKYLTKKKG